MTVDWIRSGLKRTGKTRSGLAKALGRSPSAVTDLLNGHRRLRADGIRIAVFRQTRSNEGWVDAAVNAETSVKLEDAILTRARELRLATAGSKS